MALQPVPVENFDQLIGQLIKAGEGFDPLPTDVGDHTITMGHGYTLVQWHWEGRGGRRVRVWERYEHLDDDLEAIDIVQLSDDMEAEILAVLNALNARRYQDANAAVTRFSALWSRDLGQLTRDDANILFGREAQRIGDSIRRRFTRVLGLNEGVALYHSLSNTREMAALMSRAYRGPLTINRDLVNALNRGNRAEAWFTIRYRLTTSNPDHIKGIAARQYVESQVFGLYNDPNEV